MSPLPVNLKHVQKSLAFPFLKKKKKVQQIFFFRVNPANTVHCYHTTTPFALCHSGRCPKFPLLIHPLLTRMTQIRQPSFLHGYHKTQSPPLNSFSPSFIPRNVFAPQPKKQKT